MNLDKINPEIDRALGVIQAEIDSCISRLERLAPEDLYDAAIDPRLDE